MDLLSIRFVDKLSRKLFLIKRRLFSTSFYNRPFSNGSILYGVQPSRLPASRPAPLGWLASHMLSCKSTAHALLR